MLYGHVVTKMECRPWRHVHVFIFQQLRVTDHLAVECSRNAVTCDLSFVAHYCAKELSSLQITETGCSIFFLSLFSRTHSLDQNTDKYVYILAAALVLVFLDQLRGSLTLCAASTVAKI
jgi:hypothetical protein